MKPLKIFVSYSHQDDKYCSQLLEHLCIFERSGQAKIWHDGKISAGSDWNQDISARLTDSDIVLLLLSSSFIASDFCYEKELRAALSKHRARQSVVIPILVRGCAWEKTELHALQALPLRKDGERLKPVSQWDDKDEAWLSVVREITRIIENRLPQKVEAHRLASTVEQEIKRISDQHEERIKLLLSQLKGAKFGSSETTKLMQQLQEEQRKRFAIMNLQSERLRRENDMVMTPIRNIR